MVESDDWDLSFGMKNGGFYNSLSSDAISQNSLEFLLFKRPYVF